MGYQLANASLSSLNFLRLATHPVQMVPESLSFFELPQMTSQWLILVVTCGVSGFPGQRCHGFRQKMLSSSVIIRMLLNNQQLNNLHTLFELCSLADYRDPWPRTHICQSCVLLDLHLCRVTKQVGTKVLVGSGLLGSQGFPGRTPPPRPGVEHFDNLHNGPPRLSPQALKFTLRALV